MQEIAANRFRNTVFTHPVLLYKFINYHILAIFSDLEQAMFSLHYNEILSSCSKDKLSH